MLSTLKASKIVRITGASVAVGATAALLLLGAPADAATMISLGRGL